MHAYVSVGHLSVWWHVAVSVLWMLAMKLSTVDTTTLERLAAHAVVDALRMAQLSRKEAAALMGVDYHQFCRQLRADPGAHLSLTRLLRLCGTPFWFWFGPVLMLIVARERFPEIVDSVSFFGRRRYGTAESIGSEVHDEQRRA